MADAELREQLEKLAVAEVSFSGFTWLFGPELYRRNRILVPSIYSLAVQHIHGVAQMEDGNDALEGRQGQNP